MTMTPTSFLKETCSVPLYGVVAVWRQLASTLLKYRSHDIDIKDITLKLDRCCEADPPV